MLSTRNENKTLGETNLQVVNMSNNSAFSINCSLAQIDNVLLSTAVVNILNNKRNFPKLEIYLIQDIRVTLPKG